MPGRAYASISWWLAIALVASHTSAASFIVVPNQAQSSEGGEDNGAPSDISNPVTGVSPNMRYQQIYSATHFSSVVGPQFITQISFRPDGTFGHAFATTLNDIEIRLSTTTRAVNNLSLTFADNVGPNDTVVYDGALPLSSQALGPAPKPFDIIINLQTPFVYDRSQGNLLMEVWNFSGGLTTTFDADFTQSISRLTGRVTDSTGFRTTGLGLVTRWTTTPVPEPACCITILAVLAAARSRRPKR